MKYILEQVEWLNNRKDIWDKNFSELILSFHSIIEELIEELKDKYNDKDDPFKIHKEYIDYINKSFDNLRESVKLVENKSDLIKLWDELSLNFVFWKEEFKKMAETLDNYNSIFKLGYEIFNVITTYNTKKIKMEYHDMFEGEIDDIRENINNFIKTIRIDINNRIVELDSQDIYSMTELYDKDIKDLSLNHGDEVRYYMNNGEENYAIISYDQEDINKGEEIRLVSKKDGKQFLIPKSELIEILPKHKTLNQKIADKLKKIKDNSDKLEELDEFLDKLRVSENVSYIDNIDNIDISEIILEIYPEASIIKNDDTIKFKLEGDDIFNVDMIDFKGVFNEGEYYRIVGSDIKALKNIDYILYVNKKEIYLFNHDKEKIEKIENGDILYNKSLLLKKYNTI